MSKEKKATWWKMFAHQRAAIESVSDRAAGAGLKAAFKYFDGEDIPPRSITPQAFTVFCVIRPYIDEARQDFEKSVSYGKKGAESRWGGDSPPIAPPSPPMGCLREADADADKEAEADISIHTDRECEGADKPSRHPRFVPPTVEQVTEYVKQRGSKVDPQEFIDFYASKGWMVGKNKMSDWRAACRNAEKWERWGKNPDRDRVKTDADYGNDDFFS